MSNEAAIGNDLTTQLLAAASRSPDLVVCHGIHDGTHADTWWGDRWVAIGAGCTLVELKADESRVHRELVKPLRSEFVDRIKRVRSSARDVEMVRISDRAHWFAYGDRAKPLRAMPMFERYLQALDARPTAVRPAPPSPRVIEAPPWCDGVRDGHLGVSLDQFLRYVAYVCEDGDPTDADLSLRAVVSLASSDDSKTVRRDLVQIAASSLGALAAALRTAPWYHNGIKMLDTGALGPVAPAQDARGQQQSPRQTTPPKPRPKPRHGR